MKTRQYGIKSDIDMESVQALYANRALTKLQNSIDQPVVLVADRDPSYVEQSRTALKNAQEAKEQLDAAQALESAYPVQ